MKLTQLLERLEYEVVQGDDQIEVTELINDSRKVTEGSVFVCISGAVSDGHAYVQQVAEKGAAAVIVEKDVEAPLRTGINFGSIFRISGREAESHRYHRNKRKDNDNLYGEIHSGRSWHQSRTDRYD